MNKPVNVSITQPAKRMSAEFVTMAHGGGGRAMRELIDDVFLSVFKPDSLEDQARLMSETIQIPGARIGYTTDSFVVDPLEFPGGDIGKLAVCGTVNDLAVGGAKPLWLSAGFIIEEGVEIELLRRIVASMKMSADEVGVSIVTGDTKVVERGGVDKVFINTSGIGVISDGVDLRATQVRAGDVAIVNGYLGDHGACVMAARQDMALMAEIPSDCAPLSELMNAVLEAAPNTRCARDATRGGLASALNEIADASGTRIVIDEAALPIRAEVRGVCEILGLDALYLANEGTLVALVPEDEAEAALAAMRAQPYGKNAQIIGQVKEGSAGRVEMITLFGGSRIVDMLVGAQLPRIC